MASLRGQDTDERVEGAKRSTCPAGARKEGKEEDFFLLTSRQVSLCSSGCPGTCSVDQDGFELKRFTCLCLYLLNAGIKGMYHYAQLAFSFFLKHYVYACFDCMYVCIPHACSFHRGQMNMSTGVTNSCKLPCECWELNLSPLVEQPVLLITKPFPSFLFFINFLFLSLYICIC